MLSKALLSYNALYATDLCVSKYLSQFWDKIFLIEFLNPHLFISFINYFYRPNGFSFN